MSVASTLVDDLLAAGYRDVTVLDLSASAVDAARARLGPRASDVTWLPTARYDADALHTVFGDEFEMVDRREERHRTPAGSEQQFVYCL